MDLKVTMIEKISKYLYCFSSGGCGDFFIQFLKLLPYSQHNKIYWVHCQSHLCHVKPIGEIQSWIPNLVESKNILLEGDKKKAIKSQEEKFFNKFPDGIRLTSEARNIESPHPDLSFLINSKDRNHKEYIVVQCRAGRQDNSSREFTSNAIKQIAQKYSCNIYLLGAPSELTESVGYELLRNGEHAGIYDLRGTVTLKQSFNIIANCSEFIGHDSVLLYMAQSLRKPCFGVYHLPHLPNHYLHPKWAEHTRCYTLLRSNYNSPTIIDDFSKLKRI